MDALAILREVQRAYDLIEVGYESDAMEVLWKLHGQLIRAGAPITQEDRDWALKVLQAASD